MEPSQPQRIMSRLRETFIKRYVVERTSKAEIRQQDRNRHKNRIERSGQARLVDVKDMTHNIPTT